MASSPPPLPPSFLSQQQHGGSAQAAVEQGGLGQASPATPNQAAAVAPLHAANGVYSTPSRDTSAAPLHPSATDSSSGGSPEHSIQVLPPPLPSGGQSSPPSLDRIATSRLTSAMSIGGDARAQVSSQNEMAWRRMQQEGVLAEEDIAPYFPQPAPSPENSKLGVPSGDAQQQPSQPRQLRPSIMQQNLLSAKQASSSDANEQQAAEWDQATRMPSASQSFLTPAEQSRMLQLPPEFKGAAKLTMPAYLTGPISNVTLPSRLDLLGRRGFKLLGAIKPRRIGNSVIGWAPVLSTSWHKKELRLSWQLFNLPFVFSKSFAKIMLFLRFIVLALVVILILDIAGAVDAQPGRVWPVGILCALVVMWFQAHYRRAPDGVMAFCRSMGVPEVEEYMFSYCWKVEPENVRTLAKAVWNAGVGVWIDVVKLCPGDEIRPMVRTTVKRVHKVVVFLCDEYCQSPNCCVEMLEAVQHPEKVTVCIIKNNIHPNVMRFLLELKPRGLRMCVGFDELIQLLDLDIQDMTDIAAFQWWRSQNISGAGVPSNLVPANWPMARFSVKGRVILPEKSVEVGPVYISGDCKQTGQSLALPWLLFIALAGVLVNVWDMYDKYNNYALLHSTIDYIFLAVIALCNCAPFLGFSYLLDRRRDCHVALRPLLASRSMGKDGVKVRVVGNEKDPIYVALRGFLASIGHLAPDTPQSSGGRREPRCVTVFVMEDLARRDQLFGEQGRSDFDNRFSLFIWSGAHEAPGTIPFTEDAIGQRLMRYLVLVTDWEKHGLCEALFSAIGVRVVDILHDKSSAVGQPRDEKGVAKDGLVQRSMPAAMSAAMSVPAGRGSVFGTSPAPLPPSFPLGHSFVPAAEV